MDSQIDQISDEDLAKRINESGVLSSAENSEEEGFIESGILQDPVTEEKFSVNDFDDVSLEENELVEKPSSSHLDTKKSEPISTSEINAKDNSLSSDVGGDVSEFRKTLSDLSKQLEIDRVTFLHQKLRNDGQSVPDLSLIASDIKGDNQLHPVGDEDLYSKRPFSRLQGWIVGLSFGIGRRAKKFRK